MNYFKVIYPSGNTVNSYFREKRLFSLELFCLNISKVNKMNENENNVNTFTEYKPVKLNYGKDHPDAIIESATLASVSPPDITLKLKLPKVVINEGLLSAAQFENVVYAFKAHDHKLSNGQRAGFLIGDGAGVGKGRSIAGIIYENFVRGRKKAVWMSCSSDLKHDAERDLLDLKADISVYDMKKVSVRI